MRILQIIVLGVVIVSAPVKAQHSIFGGCSDGQELGYIRVTQKVQLRDWKSNQPFVTALPGDELRICRFEGQSAVVTIFGWGDGYTLPRAAMDSVSTTASIRKLDLSEKGCLMKAIEDIQTQYGGRDQDRQFLLLARHWNIPLPQINLIRTESIAMKIAGESDLPARDCDSP